MKKKDTKGGYIVSFEYTNGEVENVKFDSLKKAQKFYNESVENNDGEELISLLQGNREIESFSPTSDEYDEEMYEDDEEMYEDDMIEIFPLDKNGDNIKLF